MEAWKDIDGYDGMYQISDIGNVRTYCNNKWGKGTTPKLKKLQDNGRGYLFVTLHGEAKKKSKQYVHRLVASAFLGASDLEVNHINGDPADNRLCNLEYVTRSQNMLHAVYALGKNRGMTKPSSKLTNTDIAEIKRRLSNDEMQKDIARDYGILQSTVSDIATGRGWGWLTNTQYAKQQPRSRPGSRRAGHRRSVVGR